MNLKALSPKAFDLVTGATTLEGKCKPCATAALLASINADAGEGIDTANRIFLTN
jgi:hypothetical protein